MNNKKFVFFKEMLKKLALLSVLFLPSIAFGATFNHNLAYGTVGTDVSQLQQFLADEGLYAGPVNATFGPITQNALITFQQQEGISATGYFGSLSRSHANTIAAAHPEWLTTLSNTAQYTNVSGSKVNRPSYSSDGIPAGATAECRDGTYSFSLHRRGTCSHHGGVANWL